MSEQIKDIEEFGNYEHIKWNEEFRKIVTNGSLLQDGSFEIIPDDLKRMEYYAKHNFEMAPQDYRDDCMSYAKKTLDMMIERGMITQDNPNACLLGIMARAEYARRNRWNKHMISRCHNIDGRCIIPADRYARWTRQMNTEYADLSEDEKQSDRDEFVVIYDAVKTYIDKNKDHD